MVFGRSRIAAADEIDKRLICRLAPPLRGPAQAERARERQHGGNQHEAKSIDNAEFRETARCRDIWPREPRDRQYHCHQTQ